MEQLLFSMFASILIFDFDLILGSFFTFWGSNGLFLGSGNSAKSILESTHVVEQLSFSMLPSVLTFNFDLILGAFFTFWGPNGLILRFGGVRTLFWGLLIQLNIFHFLCSLQF